MKTKRLSVAERKVKELSIDCNAYYPSWFPDINSLPNSDKILATIQCYYHHRFLKGFKNEFIKSNGYIYIKDKLFRSWVGEDFEKHIDYLCQHNLLQIIPMKNKLQAGYINQVNTYQIPNPNFDVWERVRFKDSKPVWKIYKLYNKSVNTNISNTRKKMIEWVEEVCISLDTDRILMDAESMTKKNFNNKFGKITIEHLREYISSIKEREVYCNSQDDFGHRFHSPFTNVKSHIINEYVTIDGEAVCQLDIVNSQMMFFAFLLLYPEKCLSLIEGSNEEKLKFQSAIEFLIDFQKQVDLSWFVEYALSGRIYEIVAQARLTTREKAKKLLFKILFSNSEQCKRTKMDNGKYLLKPIIQIADYLNKEKLIPMMMQRLEVATIISHVAEKLVKENIKILTVHDSVVCKKSDTERVKAVIQETFKQLFNFDLKDENIKTK